MICQNCGQSNDDGQYYCRNCGAPLTQPQTYQPPVANAPKPYGWASPSSPLHNIAGSHEPPPQVQPLAPPVQARQQARRQPPPVSTVPHNHLTRGGYRCPRCASTSQPFVQSRISDGGWVMFAVMLIFCFPLFWIGFLMREENRLCPNCLCRVG